MTVENTRRGDKVLAVLFCAGLLCVFVLIMGRFVYNQIGKRVGWIQFNYYNAAAEFPFEERTIVLNEKHDALEKIKNRILVAESKITQYSQQQFFFNRQIAVIGTYFKKLLGLDMTSSVMAENPVVVVEDEWLGVPYKKADVATAVKKTIAFARQMESEGRNFFVFENPHKHAAFPPVYADYYEENRTAVNDVLRKNDIRVVDIDAYIQERGVDFKTIFFKTDHHWNPQAGLWANSILCEYLNEQFGYQISTDIFDVSQYDVRRLEKSFLGSYGSTVTEAYAKKEDFDILLPTYKSDLSVFRSNVGKVVRGSIPETLYDFSLFNRKWQVSSVLYSLYPGTDLLLVSHNNALHDGSSLLFIHFSFGDVQIPTLAQAVEDFYAIDLRAFNGSLQTFIKEKNPQTVVLAYPTTAFSANETQNASGKQFFDFN